jgi:hypothetical protein
MALNRTIVNATPERVFEILLDPYAYGDWVPGAKRVRGVDSHWPRSGSAFHHTQGLQLGRVRDHTEVVHASPPRSIALLAHARPFGVAAVTVGVRPAPGERSRLAIREEPAPGSGAWWIKRLADPAMFVRNIVSLRRLKKLAESDRTFGSGAPPAP